MDTNETLINRFGCPVNFEVRTDLRRLIGPTTKNAANDFIQHNRHRFVGMVVVKVVAS